MNFEALIRAHLGPNQPYVVMNGNQLFTPAPDGTLICIWGDYRRWSPEKAEAHIATYLK